MSWWRWPVVALAAVMVLAAGLLLSPWREQLVIGPKTDRATPPDQTKAANGTFPPAFSDVRPDLSQRTDYVDVCGVGRVPVKPDGQPDWQPELLFDLSSGQRLIEAAASKAAAGGSDLDRALAFYVTGAFPVQRDVSDNNGAPRPNDDRSQQVARVAVATRDPATYALAFYVCGKAHARPGGACAQLSAANWAQLDADNAVPWLYLADVARERSDLQGVDTALQRASQAKTLQPYMYTPIRLADSAIVNSATRSDADAAIAVLAGISAALPLPDLHQVVQYCNTGAAQRKEVCSGLAEVFTQRSTVLITIPIGARIGERVGWPSERVAEVKARVATLQRPWNVELKHQYSCAALERGRRFLTDAAQLGEVGALERIATAAQQSTR